MKKHNDSYSISVAEQLVREEALLAKREKRALIEQSLRDGMSMSAAEHRALLREEMETDPLPFSSIEELTRAPEAEGGAAATPTSRVTDGSNWIRATFLRASSTMAPEVPSYGSLAASTKRDESVWEKRFELATDAWVMEAWVCGREQEVRLALGPEINEGDLLCVEMTGIRRKQVTQFAIERRPADARAGERIVVEGLTVTRLWHNRDALLKAGASQQADLVPRLLLDE